MRRVISFLVGALVVGTLVIASTGLVNASPAPQGSTGPTGSTGSGAIAETFFYSYPMDFVLPSPCTGHEIHFVGELNSVAHVTLTPTGRIHVAVSNWFPRTTGVDLTTGQAFMYVGALPSTQNLDISEVPWEWTNVLTSNFIGQGPRNNLVQHVVTHLTINALGEVTSSIENVSIECR